MGAGSTGLAETCGVSTRQNTATRKEQGSAAHLKDSRREVAEGGGDVMKAAGGQGRCPLPPCLGLREPQVGAAFSRAGEGTGRDLRMARSVHAARDS